MASDIQRLLYLCQVKNDLNRKRRRFYHYMNHDVHFGSVNGEYKYYTGDAPEKHITRWHARRGYRKAQRDMKSMTKEMRQMRLDMGVRLIWTDHGAIGAVEFQGARIEAKDFKRYYEAEVFEMEMFK